MEFLGSDEFARRMVPSRFKGFFSSRMPVRFDLLGILIVNERWERLLLSGTENIPGGLFSWQKSAIVWVREGSVPLDFTLDNLVTGDRTFINVEVRLWLKFAKGSETLFLRNTLFGKSVITFDDLKQYLIENLRSIVQKALRDRSFCDLGNIPDAEEILLTEIEIGMHGALRLSGLTCMGISNLQLGEAKLWSCPNDGWIPSAIEFAHYSSCPRCGFDIPIPCPNGHFPMVKQLKENRLCPECETDLSIVSFKRLKPLAGFVGDFA